MAAGQAQPKQFAVAAWAPQLRAENAFRLAGLPLVLLPTPTPTPTAMMAIIYSGDGGWRDLDKQIGEKLQGVGIPAAGFDTLSTFGRKSRRSSCRQSRQYHRPLHANVERAERAPDRVFLLRRRHPLAGPPSAGRRPGPHW